MCTISYENDDDNAMINDGTSGVNRFIDTGGCVFDLYSSQLHVNKIA